MGYRHYFYKVEKEVLEKLHTFTETEFEEWQKQHKNVTSYGDVPLYKIGEVFFEFGKYYENAGSIMEQGKPLFEDKELTDIHQEKMPHIVGQEAVLDAIQYFRSLIIKYHEDLLGITADEDMSFERRYDDLTDEERYKRDIESRYEEWTTNLFMKGDHCTALNLDTTDDALTHSWKYEYAIFDLVRLYKQTDWDRYGLLFMGW